MYRNNHFAAIASDQPSLESWPIREGDVHLHQVSKNYWFVSQILIRLCRLFLGKFPFGYKDVFNIPLVSLWGMPIGKLIRPITRTFSVPFLVQTPFFFKIQSGELFDLEALAKYANETGRYTFFFSSWPLNVLGGVASPPNAAAIF